MQRVETLSLQAAQAELRCARAELIKLRAFNVQGLDLLRAQEEEEHHTAELTAGRTDDANICRIFWGAHGLRDADGALAEKSDSFVVVRLGGIDSTWDAKGLLERRSATVVHRLDPVTSLGFPVHPRDLHATELQLRVDGADTLSDSDTLMGAWLRMSDVVGAGVGGLWQFPTPQGVATLSVGPVTLLNTLGVLPTAAAPADARRPHGAIKECAHSDITDKWPPLGVAPSHVSMRGIFWQEGQEDCSTIISFGASTDGDQAALVQLTNDAEHVARSAGDRVWSYASRKPIENSQGLPSRIARRGCRSILYRSSRRGCRSILDRSSGGHDGEEFAPSKGVAYRAVQTTLGHNRSCVQTTGFLGRRIFFCDRAMRSHLIQAHPGYSMAIPQALAGSL